MKAVVFSLAVALATTAAVADAVNSAFFTTFRIEGKDALAPCDEAAQYRNPIIDGMAPDPSITRKGDDFYLANSSFGYFPGVPVWHSKDLVNWDFCGYVQSRPSQLAMKRGMDVNHGVYAPDIKYNPYNDTFYMIVAVVNGGGSVLYKTKDPYAGWSEPVFVAVPDIDPAIFFEDAETAYIVNSDAAPEPFAEYVGHKAIRMRKYDLVNDCLVDGYEKVILDKGLHPEEKPIWCEGPHLYKVDGVYYLMAAEGGTGPGHCEAVYRAESVEGPYLPCKVNPVLTQRDLPEGRENGVYCTGHADLVDTPTGEWMAVFLGIRPYADAGGGERAPTGRNTYLLPVKWDKQPIILEKGAAVPLVVDMQPWQIDAARKNAPNAARLSGNRVFCDQFETPEVDPLWIQLRTPREKWYRSAPGGRSGMEIDAREESLYDRGNPSYLCRWLTSRSFDAETSLVFSPRSPEDIAGLALVQNEEYNYVFGKGLDGEGNQIVTLVRCEKGVRNVVASARLDGPSRSDGQTTELSLRVEGRDDRLSFFWRQGGGEWTLLSAGQSADILTTSTAGGFIGATVGMYAFGKAVKTTETVWVNPAKDGNDEVLFSAAFETSEVEDAQLRIAGATCYRIEVNGKFLGFGPARGPLGFDREETWPLKDVARSGTNTIDIKVASYRDNNYSFVNQSPFLWAEVVDGRGRVLCATGRDFTARRTGRNCNAGKFTFQRPMREERTLGAEEISKQEVHRSAMDNEVKVVQVAPRPRLDRRVPLPTFEIEGMKMERPSRSDGQSGGKNSNSLFSLSRNETGFIGAKVTCESPATVRLTFDEMLTNGEVNPGRFYQGGDVIWHFAKAGTYDVETFDPYTLKYARFETTEGSAKVTDAFLRRYENPMVGYRPRTTGDAELDRIREAAVASFAQNTVDVMTDCPSRERAGWLCDSFFTARAAQHLLGGHDYETLFLENYARATSFPGLPEGMVPMCYPSDVIVKGDHTFIPNWAMFFVLEVEEYMKRGGEREIVDALKPRVEGIIAFLSRYENEDGLLENLPGWIFVEWSQANKLVDGVNYPSNMLWAETLAAAGRLCWRMDWCDKARKVREKVREQSFDGEFFRDHAVRAERPSRSDGQRADTTLEVRPDRTETCQYYAFYFGVADFKRDAALWNRLVRRDFGDLAKSNAFIGNLMRMELLARDGRRDQMREEIKGYYLKMADSTGTLWEHDAPHASCCHAFSSFLAVLLDLNVVPSSATTQNSQ